MNAVFLFIRAFHVLAAAIWLGAMVVIALFLMPVLRQLGPAAGPVMTGLQRRGLMSFLPSIGGLTVLSGLWLYWRFTAGFDPAISGSRGAILFGIGAVTGILALIIGGSIVRRSSLRAMEIGTQAASVADVAERGRLVQRAEQLRQRASTFAVVVVGLLVITIVLMALGHYV